MNIAILAPLPPPFGGVSVHATRLIEALREAGDDVAVIDVGRPSLGLFVKVAMVAWRRDRLMHYHSDEGNWKMAIVLGLIFDAVGAKYVITLHSFRERVVFRNVLVRTLLRTTYDAAQRVVCISEHVREAVCTLIDVDATQCTVISSALPVSAEERSTPLPSSVPKTWLDAPVRVLFNVSRLVRYHDKDLYGLDVVLDAWRTVNAVHPSARLLVVIATVVDVPLYTNAMERVQTLQGVDVLTDHPGLLMPFTVAAHVVVRATRTEGGPSLTIQEALENGCIAVASNSVARPRQTLLFRSEDAEDCARVIGEAIHQVCEHGRPTPLIPSTLIVDRLRDIYRASTTTARS
ncbi:hypothetical protein BH10BAC6_BH10BAC6_01160 [soil metagenome]